MNNLVCLCAGGTGGHINAALSLGRRFEERGFEVRYFSGTRYLDYQLFGPERQKTFHFDSKPLRSSNPVDQVKNLALNVFVFLSAAAKFIRRRPVAAIGCGGYICGPTLAAAKLLGIKVYIIEQNAAAGVTNRLLAKIANKVFLNFEHTAGIGKNAKTVAAGNPVRSSIVRTEPKLEGPLKILVFGGSLGAEQINSAISELVQRDWEFPVSFIHQTGKGKHVEALPGGNVEYEQKEYLDNMDELYRWSNIVVSRAGASTVSELRVAGRPSILIPFPFATDDHQRRNAEQLAKEENFYVKVTDPDLGAGALAKSVLDGISEVREKNLFRPFKECARVDSCEIIYKEVVQDVRNQ